MKDTISLSLEKDFSSLEPTILENLDDLPTKLTSRQLEELRSFKQRLSQFSARSQEVQRVIQEILEEDENMTNMYLTEKSTFPKHRRNLVEHEEIEAVEVKVQVRKEEIRILTWKLPLATGREDESGLEDGKIRNKPSKNDPTTEEREHASSVGGLPENAQTLGAEARGNAGLTTASTTGTMYNWQRQPAIYGKTMS